MLITLISAVTALFLLISGVVLDSALQPLQDAQDKVVTALSEVDPPNGNSSSNSAGENGQNEVGDGEIVDENGDPAEPGITKVAAYNTKAELALLAGIPQIAVDSSVALIGCNEIEAACTIVYPTENGSENSTNTSIGLAKAEEAKSNRP